MNYKQPSPIVKLCMILGIDIAFSVYLLVTGSASKAAIVFVIAMAIGVFTYLKETKNDRKAGKLKPDIESGRHYIEAEWREKYLSYKMSEPFEMIKGDMKQDMLRHYRTSKNIVSLSLSAFLLLCDACIFIENIKFAILGLVLFGFLFWLAISDFLGKPVRKFYKRTDVDFQAVSDSYMKGKMLAYQNNGINIGSQYLVAFNDRKVIALKLQNVGDITKKIVREKEYTNSIYTGEEYKHFAVINSDTEVELNEFQLELIIEEFHRAVGGQQNDTAEVIDDIFENIVS